MFAATRLLKVGLLTALLTVTSSAEPAAPQKWAILVGVNAYRSQEITPLLYAANDVKLLAETLETNCGVPSSHIFTLVSEKDTPAESQPTRSNVATLFTLLGRKVGPEDTVYFFYSGHGVHMDDRSFLVTPEADSRNANTLAATTIDSRELGQWLRNTGAKNLMVVLDACRSDPTRGANGDGKLATVMERQLKLVPRQETETVAFSGQQTFATLFACAKEQRSYEDAKIQHGYFTYYMGQALKGAAVQADGTITLQSVLNYVAAEVPRAASRSQTSGQVPWMAYEGPGPGAWVFGKGSALPTTGDQASLVREKLELQQELARLKLANDERARQIQREAEDRILQVSKSTKEQSQAFERDLISRLEEAQKQAREQREQLDVLQAGILRQKLELQKMEAEKTTSQESLAASRQALRNQLAEQASRRERATVMEAEAEATRLAALNRTSNSQPLAATRKIQFLDALDQYERAKFATSLEILLALSERRLIYEVGQSKAGRFKFDSVGKPLDGLAAKKMLDSKQAIAVEVPGIETSSNFSLVTYNRPPSVMEIQEKMQTGRRQIETVIVGSWRELEALNNAQELTELRSDLASGDSLLKMLRALEGTRSLEVRSESAVVPPEYARDTQGNLVVKVPAHQGLKYIFSRETTPYSLEIRRSQKEGRIEYNYVDRICAYEARQALLAKQSIMVRKLGGAQTEIRSLSELQLYLQMNGIGIH